MNDREATTQLVHSQAAAAALANVSLFATSIAVTPKSDGDDSRNTCPICAAMLTGRQKTCSVNCRVALHRRLARQGTPDGAGAVLSVARRLFNKDICRAQVAARNKLRQRH